MKYVKGKQYQVKYGHAFHSGRVGCFEFVTEYDNPDCNVVVLSVPHTKAVHPRYEEYFAVGVDDLVDVKVIGKTYKVRDTHHYFPGRVGELLDVTKGVAMLNVPDPLARYVTVFTVDADALESLTTPSDIALGFAAQARCEPKSSNKVMDCDLTTSIARIIDPLLDSLSTAWTIIANSSDWTNTRDEAITWRQAARKWRDDEFHRIISGSLPVKAVKQESNT